MTPNVPYKVNEEIVERRWTTVGYAARANSMAVKYNTTDAVS